MKKILFLLFAVIATAFSIIAEENSFGKGVFVFTSKGVNFLEPEKEADFWHENVCTSLSPGQLSQNMTFLWDASEWKGKFYFGSGPETDPETGGTRYALDIITPSTMEVEKIVYIPSHLPGFAGATRFVGLNENKGYILTNQGVYSLNLQTYELGTLIDDPEDQSAKLYNSGVISDDGSKLFLVQYIYDILVFDTQTDQLINTISLKGYEEGETGTHSLIKDNNGDIWAMTHKLQKFVKIDPSTYELTELEVADNPGFGSLSGEIYRSMVYNKLTNCILTDNGTDVFEVNLTTGSFKKVITNLHGALHNGAIDINPENGEIWVGEKIKNKKNNFVTRYDKDYNLIRDYTLGTPASGSREYLRNFIFYDPSTSAIESIGKDEASLIGDIFNLHGQKVASNVEEGYKANLTPGFYIWKAGETSKKFIVK